MSKTLAKQTQETARCPADCWRGVPAPARVEYH